MNVIITGGGTGGHVFPALSVAKIFKKNGHNVLYFGSIRGIEKTACQDHGIPCKCFPSEPFTSIRTFKGILARLSFIIATLMVLCHFIFRRPSLVFATGGYSSAPVLFAAWLLRIPLYLHEQNTIPGRTIQLFSQVAKHVFTTFHTTKKYMKHVPITRTGLPILPGISQGISQEISQEVSQEISQSNEPFCFTSKERKVRDIHANDTIHILITGGSQGAKAINTMILNSYHYIRSNIPKNIKMTHITGKNDYESCLKLMEICKIDPKHYHLISFADKPALYQLLSETDILIGRSGAGTLIDSALFGIPSILIPYPYSTGNHQIQNGIEFQDMGFTKIIHQEHLNQESLLENLNFWIENPLMYRAASSELMKWNPDHAAEKVYLNISQTLF